MTWKEFKDALEKEGVTDDMELIYIDIRKEELDELAVEVEDDGFYVY